MYLHFLKKDKDLKIKRVYFQKEDKMVTGNFIPDNLPSVGKYRLNADHHVHYQHDQHLARNSCDGPGVAKVQERQLPYDYHQYE